MAFIDAAALQQKALVLIERHLDQLLHADQVANASALVIQNYAKTLVILAKDQREQANGADPATYTDAELATLASVAAKTLGHELDYETTTDETDPTDSGIGQDLLP